MVLATSHQAHLYMNIIVEIPFFMVLATKDRYSFAKVQIVEIPFFLWHLLLDHVVLTVLADC